MKAILFLFLCTSLMAQSDEQFIEDSGLQIKSGYGNTSKHYFSYDQDDLGRTYRFKKNRCYKGKVNKFKATFKRLEKKGFTYTTTETFINNLANGNGQIATFLVTYVKDTYEGNWIEDETKEATSGRPADYLIYRYVHFECQLKAQTQVHDKSRLRGKKIIKGSAETLKSGKSKSK